jgi:hypothetical protein
MGNLVSAQRHRLTEQLAEVDSASFPFILTSLFHQVFLVWLRVTKIPPSPSQVLLYDILLPEEPFSENMTVFF